MKGKIIIRLIVFYVAVFFSQHALSQEKKQLNLNTAIEMSLQNSKQLKGSKARIEEAVAQVKEAENNRLPSFNITGSYIRLNSANIDLKSNSNNSSNGNSTPKISQALYGIANISYPIYAGGRIKYGIESAKYLVQAAKLDADNDKEGVILNTLNAYTNLYKAGVTIKVVKESLASSRQRDSNFSRLEQNGLLARNDLLKTELQTSNIELTLLDAENNYKLANINMNLMLEVCNSVFKRSFLANKPF